MKTRGGTLHIGASFASSQWKEDQIFCREVGGCALSVSARVIMNKTDLQRHQDLELSIVDGPEPGPALREARDLEMALCQWGSDLAHQDRQRVRHRGPRHQVRHLN